ncbi:PorV/PorQ family protein [candidate division KSB1 bacterium]|nr:PorV/PorQ family protein [candidate division KSB1 bacterium]
MKKIIITLTVICSAVMFSMPAQAQIKKVGQTGLQFLKIDVAPRPAAMAGAYTMPGNDASAMFYNPAGISRMENEFDFFASQTQWFSDITYNAVGVAKNVGNWGTFGVSILMADYGNIDGYIVANNANGYESTGTIDVGAYAVGLSYARSLTNKFSIGGQAKIVNQHLGSSTLVEGGNAVKNEVSGFAFDFGTIFNPGYKSLQIGMTMNNFSGQFKYEEEAFELPLTFRIGAAMDILDVLVGEHQNPLMLSVDAIHPRDYTERVQVGGEYTYNEFVALRAGYKFNYDEESVSLGAGLKQKMGNVVVKVDYSFSALDVLDNVNRFSLGLSF